jgi:tartrate-resistant acid phosphatase type 5
VWNGVGRVAGGVVAILILLLALVAGAPAQPFYTYLGDVTAESVLIAWGTTRGGGNTIGRDSQPLGSQMVLRVDGRDYPAEKNWRIVEGLAADKPHPYDVLVDGKSIGHGSFRTLPARPHKLAFFVIGDYGDGKRPQIDLSGVMAREMRKRAGSDNPVRFVLTTGDNIYAKGFKPFLWQSGNKDSHWEKRFFEAYKEVAAALPFFPSPGNHDGNESEKRSDLPVYLDNFLMPGGRGERFYRFAVGDLVEFFSLDSTKNRMGDGEPMIFAAGGQQHGWLELALKESRAVWKIPFYHHPLFTAGPRHGSSLDRLRHWQDLFAAHGVRATFAGHEHNFQFSERNSATKEILHIVSGSGGALRGSDIRRNLAAANVAGWANQHHFLLVELDRSEVTITPIGIHDILVRDGSGEKIEMPLRVTAQ